MPRLDELAGQDAAGWLCRVAANLCIDELRRSQRRHSSGRLADETWDELASPGPFGSPEATLEQRELRLAVWRATLALPPQQRLALALREWHGMSYAQVAGALSTSVSAVETLLFRARQGFRRAYEQRLIQPTADDAGCAWCLERLSASVDDCSSPSNSSICASSPALGPNISIWRTAPLGGFPDLPQEAAPPYFPGRRVAINVVLRYMQGAGDNRVFFSDRQDCAVSGRLPHQRSAPTRRTGSLPR
jgi:RNA polymerase sigma factor (sigma-70 family)